MKRNIKGRQAQILEMIRQKGTVKTKELMDYFNTTSETIRKDLIYLDQLGVIEKSHGGARLAPSYIEAPLAVRSQIHSEQKKRIAEAAIRLIPNGSLIYMDGGSTILPLAERLSERERVTVITMSLAIANIVISQPTNTVFLTSGFIKRDALTIKGPYTKESLNHFKTAYAFMGTNGMLYYDGATCKDYEDIPLKTTVIKNCENPILLCDSQKFYSEAVLQYASWEEFSYLITDSQASPALQERIRKKTHLLLA